jgi:hypothetical protein
MIPVEWPKAKIWGLAKVFLCWSIIVTYLSHLNPQNNIVSNWKGLLPAV